jgi:hypothetical protein
MCWRNHPDRVMTLVVADPYDVEIPVRRADQEKRTVSQTSIDEVGP